MVANVGGRTIVPWPALDDIANAVAGVEDVIAGRSDHDVGTEPAAERVGAGSALEPVGGAETVEAIDAAAAVKRVGCTVAVQRVVPSRAADDLHAQKGVPAEAASEAVVETGDDRLAGGGVARCIGAGPADQEVVTAASDEDVVPGQAAENVISSAPGQEIRPGRARLRARRRHELETPGPAAIRSVVDPMRAEAIAVVGVEGRRNVHRPGGIERQRVLARVQEIAGDVDGTARKGRV